MKWHRGWIIGATLVGSLFLLHIADLSAKNAIALGKLFDFVVGFLFFAWCAACFLDTLWEGVSRRRVKGPAIHDVRSAQTVTMGMPQCLVSRPGEPVQRLARLECKPEPHWAIAVLLDPRVPLVEFVENELVRGHDYVPDADPEKALSGFDETIEGWVPWWFPHRMHLKRWTEEEDGVDLTPPQRLDWFDRALAYYARSEYPPPEPLSLMKRTIALSMIQMLCRAEEGEIPGVDQMDSPMKSPLNYENTSTNAIDKEQSQTTSTTPIAGGPPGRNLSAEPRESRGGVAQEARPASAPTGEIAPELSGNVERTITSLAIRAMRSKVKVGRRKPEKLIPPQK